MLWQTCHPTKVDESEEEPPESSVKGAGHTEAPGTEKWQW